MIPTEARRPAEPAEIFHEVPVHRWYPPSGPATRSTSSRPRATTSTPSRWPSPRAGRRRRVIADSARLVRPSGWSRRVLYAEAARVGASCTGQRQDAPTSTSPREQDAPTRHPHASKTRRLGIPIASKTRRLGIHPAGCRAGRPGGGEVAVVRRRAQVERWAISEQSWRWMVVLSPAVTGSPRRPRRRRGWWPRAR